MTLCPGPAKSRGPRSGNSLTTKREERARAEAEGLAMLELETTRRRAKTERLKKLREARDAGPPKTK